MSYKNFKSKGFGGKYNTPPPPPPPRVIYIDVDKTLINLRGVVNTRIVDWARDKHKDGFEIVIWSSRGTEHCINAANKSGLNDIISAAISKPGFIVDDQAWGWIKYTKVVGLEKFLPPEG